MSGLVRVRAATWCGAVALVAQAVPATAMEFDLAGTSVKFDNLFTVGALMRMQERDLSLIGKSSVTPGLCVARTSANPDPADPSRTYSGDTCTTGGTGAGNLRAINAPGSFNPNGDNGDLNFDRHDIVNAAAKLTSDLSFSVADFNFFARGYFLFDNRYAKLIEKHPDTTAQYAETDFSDAGKQRLGRHAQVLDYFVSRSFEINDRQMSVKLGSQVINWGESAFLLANSLNSINPADQSRLRVPGFDLKELAQPQGMLVVNAELAQGYNLETFYQYQWKPVVVDPVGSFFSSSDTLGEGGSYAMLSFAKAPEDPGQNYEPWRNNKDPGAVLGSTSSRTILRDFAEEERRKPRNGGQYGAALKMFFDEINGGTEFGLYFANYHARVPSISGIAAQATCVPAPTSDPAQNVANLVADCGIPPQNFTTLAQLTADPAANVSYQPATRDALPLDTARLIVEYPENIRLYGLSFNTTVGDYAISGEYAYRPNLPLQVHSTDLVFALLQPAFPSADFSIGAATLPGRRTAVPDFVSTVYRDHPPQAGEYIRGWEPMKIGQAGLSILKTIGGDNPLAASQITVLLELGYTQVFGFPDLSELQFNGGGTDTHVSSGGDGSIGLNPRDIRSNPDDPTSSRTTQNLRQNPTAQDRRGFGTKDSYGYRLVTLTRYDNGLFGGNVEFLNAFFHDVRGVGPGLGQNFVEGRMQALSGIRYDYLSKYIGELRYTWFFGGGLRDSLRDRDNLLLSFGYQF